MTPLTPDDPPVHVLSPHNRPAILTPQPHLLPSTSHSDHISILMSHCTNQTTTRSSLTLNPDLVPPQTVMLGFAGRLVTFIMNFLPLPLPSIWTAFYPSSWTFATINLSKVVLQVLRFSINNALHHLPIFGVQGLRSSLLRIPRENVIVHLFPHLITQLLLSVLHCFQEFFCSLFLTITFRRCFSPCFATALVCSSAFPIAATSSTRTMISDSYVELAHATFYPSTLLIFCQHPSSSTVRETPFHFARGWLLPLVLRTLTPYINRVSAASLSSNASLSMTNLRFSLS